MQQNHSHPVQSQPVNSQTGHTPQARPLTPKSPSRWKSSGSFLKSVFIRYRLPILSGILIGTSYIPFPPWALFFCLSPLFSFWWLNAENGRQVFFAGWITQFILNLIGFHWIAYTAVEFGHFHWAFGILVLFGFAAIAHLYYPIGGLIAWWLIRGLRVRGVWALFTYLLSFLITDRFFSKIFPWHLGYPWLWAGWPGAQFSDVIGFEGLYYATAFVSALVAWTVAEGLLRPGPSSRKAWIIAGSAGLLISLLNLAGLGRANDWKTTNAELRVLQIQGNIGNFEKYMQELREDFGVPIVRKYIEMSRKAVSEHPDADVLVWPETAFPGSFDPNQMYRPFQVDVRGMIRDLKTPLIVGGYSYEASGGRSHVFNSLFYLNSSGVAPVRPYRKSILLVFGETFPFSEYIPYMDKLFPEQGSFTRGSGPLVWKLDLDGKEPKRVSIGPQICYEGLYPWFAAAEAHDGAEIFANVTNDSWFWKPFEPNQHLYMTLARAIEFRRPLFRATNTGISTAMLASGEILEKSPLHVEWTGLTKIPYLSNPPHTIYERFGWVWPWVLAVTLVLMLVIGKSVGVGSGREGPKQT